MSTDTPTTAGMYAQEVRAHLADLPAEQLDSIMDGLDTHFAEVVADGQPDLVAALGTPEAYAADLRAAAGIAQRAATVGTPSSFKWSRQHSALTFALGIGLVGLAVAVIARRQAGVAEVGEVLAVALAVGVAWWVTRLVVQRSGLSGGRRTIASGALAFGAMCTAAVCGAVVVDRESGGGAPSPGFAWETSLPFTSVPFPLASDFTSTKVQVANCSEHNGVARMMTQILADEGFTTVDPTNGTCDPKIDTSYVIYNEGTAGAEAVANTVAGVLGGLSVEPGTLPIKVGSGAWAEGSGVVLLLGNDLAGKTLEQILDQARGGGFTATTAPGPAAPPVTTTTVSLIEPPLFGTTTTVGP